jgi:hypothetical protein
LISYTGNQPVAFTATFSHTKFPLYLFSSALLKASVKRFQPLWNKGMLTPFITCFLSLVVFPSHSKGPGSPLQLDAQTRSQPKLLMQVLNIFALSQLRLTSSLTQAWNLFSCDHFFVGPIAGCLFPRTFHSNTTHWSFERLHSNYLGRGHQFQGFG